MLLLAAKVYNSKKWLWIAIPKTVIRAMAFIQTKTREGFAYIKNLLQQLIVNSIAALIFLYAKTNSIENKKQQPYKSF